MTKTASPGLFYGWKVTLASAGIFMLSQAFGNYGNSVVTPMFAAAYGWNADITGVCAGVMFAFSALFSIPVSILITKKGPRFTVILALTMGAIANGLLAFVVSNPVFYVLMFVFVGFMIAGAAFGGCPCLINAWFDRNKAPAMALYFASGSIGGFVTPMIAQRLTERYVRGGWIFAFCLTLTSLFLAVLFLKDTPEEIGEIPDGHLYNERHPSVRITMQKLQVEKDIPPLKRCIRSLPFIGIVIIFTCVRIFHGSFSSYIVVYSMARGLPYEQASLLLGLFSIVGLFSRLSVSLLDVLKIPKRLFYTVSVMTLASGAFLFSSANTMPVFALSSVLVGLGFGWILPFNSIILPICFDRSNFPILNGIVTTGGLIGAASGSILVLFIHTLTGSYQFAFRIFFAALSLCTVIAMLIPIRLIGCDSSEA